MALSLTKMNAYKRIKEEYQEMINYPISNIGATVGLTRPDDFYEWKCTLLGPKDTSYAGGIFLMIIQFPDNYPEKVPEVFFKTPIYHLNINPMKPKYEGSEPLGHVSISILNWWRHYYRIRQVLCDIFALLFMANPDSPYGLARANEFKFNRVLHEEKIKYFTKKYANPRFCNICKIYDDWEFSYDK
jgi:ubiquitin-conjugating enzyme E2 D/E